MKILLVEDDVFLKQLYTDILQREGYEIVPIDTGDTALTAMQNNTWDLILLDILLPNLDGFEILNKLIQDNKRPSCPIIFLTNLEETEVNKEKLSKADDYWIKSSMSPPEFIKKVKSILP